MLVSSSELPAIEDIASLSLPDESVEDHLPNGVPGSLHVENNNDFPHPSEAVTTTEKEPVQSISTLIIDINGYDYTIGGPLAPPPAAQFKSMEDLFLFCKNWSKPHGYAVAKANSHAGKNVYIRCNRGGEFRGAVLNESGRQTATSKIDCPFQLKGSVPTSQKILNKLWTLEIRNADHNHGPSASPLAHASHRALLPKQYEEIRRLLQSNLKPAQILLQLRTSDNETYATNKTISNALQKIRRDDLAVGPIEALLCYLEGNELVVGHQNHLHWSTLRKALSVVFPDSQANLCTWHLNKNIATNCKKNFGSATTEDGWDNFMELFVVAWACQYAHLRNLNTSRVESGHAYLKTFINSSTGDLLSVFKSLGLTVDSQINHVHESIGRETVKTLVNVPKSFIPILGYISTFAIKECIKQFKRIKELDPSEPCSQTVTIGIGIPCAHKIKEILEAGKSLSPEDFHDQWHLQYNPEYTHDDEPELDFDEEMRNLTISLTNDPPETQARLLKQIKKIAAGTHNAVPIQAPAKEKAKRSKTEETRKSKRVKKDASAPHDDSDAEESPSDSSYNIDQESHHSDGVHLALEDVISHNFDEAKSTHEENVERSSSDEDTNASPDDEGAVTAAEIAYSSQVPQHLKHYITKIFDPLADGNCGFRCLAQALGYDDNGWLRVPKRAYCRDQRSQSELLEIAGGRRINQQNYQQSGCGKRRSHNCPLSMA
ncbi:hypothetical protein PSTT_08055 [Puccinia striiformis]|uniref:OTU domain-containing protein n=1 Tax=Puccinia striiformis TaxID=27350 RepID=A0A2S4VDW0_9BASI|nr:hypothetical protein PSTT_08055 [Puccinia striiformis]